MHKIKVENEHKHIFGIKSTTLQIENYKCWKCGIYAYSYVASFKLFYHNINYQLDDYNSWYCDDICNEILIKEIIE